MITPPPNNYDPHTPLGMPIPVHALCMLGIGSRGRGGQSPPWIFEVTNFAAYKETGIDDCCRPCNCLPTPMEGGYTPSLMHGVTVIKVYWLFLIIAVEMEERKAPPPYSNTPTWTSEVPEAVTTNKPRLNTDQNSYTQVQAETRTNTVNSIHSIILFIHSPLGYPNTLSLPSFPSSTGGDYSTRCIALQQGHQTRELPGCVHLHLSLLLLAVWSHCYRVQLTGVHASTVITKLTRKGKIFCSTFSLAIDIAKEARHNCLFVVIGT